MSIVIDSITYDVPLKVVKRKAELLFKYAERNQQGDLLAEAIGTYYNFDCESGMSATNVTDYAALWVKLTDPNHEHTIVMPDESGTLTFNCYFANITDQVVKQKAGINYFRNLSFSVIAISPARTPT